MRNYITFGPISLRVSRKWLAVWGFPLIKIGGFDLITWHNDGALGLVSYHPKGSLCWHWSVAIRKGRLSKFVQRAEPRWRKGQWHDHYWLPFGFHVSVARQDHHKRLLAKAAA